MPQVTAGLQGCVGGRFTDQFVWLGNALFTMNVHERVVPNFVVETLWVFGDGMLIVLVFDYVVRLLHGHFISLASNRIDLLFLLALLWI